MVAEERNWREIFQVQEVNNYELKTETVGDCNENCLEAKELKCVCKCHGKNHGAALKACVKPLDTYPLNQDHEKTLIPWEQIC